MMIGKCASETSQQAPNKAAFSCARQRTTCSASLPPLIGRCAALTACLAASPATRPKLIVSKQRWAGRRLVRPAWAARRRAARVAGSASMREPASAAAAAITAPGAARHPPRTPNKAKRKEGTTRRLFDPPATAAARRVGLPVFHVERCLVQGRAGGVDGGVTMAALRGFRRVEPAAHTGNALGA